MKNVIVTGASGFIGVHLIHELLLHDCHVIAVVRPYSNHIGRIPLDKRVNIIELDSNEINLLPALLDEKQYESFFHLAWEGIRAVQRDDKVMQVKNYHNAVRAMETARLLKCKRFLGVGSQAEYGNCAEVITEETIPKPISEYGKSKLNAYHRLRSLALDKEIEFIWARIFSVYGRYDNEESLIMSTLKKLIHNETIQLTECKQLWDFLHVKDAAKALYQLGLYQLGTSNYLGGIYNIASGESKQLMEFVQQMKQVVNSSSKLEFGAIPYGFEGMVSLNPSVDKLKSSINWSCQVSFKDGILELI